MAGKSAPPIPWFY